MPTRPPVVLLQDTRPGHERRKCFQTPRQIIQADVPDEIEGAFEAASRAMADGHFVAGYFSYELGYLLEPRLRPLLWEKRTVPLIWLGVFESMEECGTNEIREASPDFSVGPLVHGWDEPAYRERFSRVRDYIAAGDVYQVNLSFRSRFRMRGEPFALYEQLAGRAQAAHCAFVDDGVRSILSFSPELFFDVAAKGRIVARPIKGTAARGRDEPADAAARSALAASAKNRAENLMIVDLMRNDLGRIAEIGSVRVPDLFAIETYPTLHQMVSTVTATLKPDTDIATLIHALFPCGSVTGAPKLRAMEIIRELETEPRGVYCGAIGYFAPNGLATFNVAIRTMTIADGIGELGIGGAVVYDSEAHDEYEECLLKARYFDAARISAASDRNPAL